MNVIISNLQKCETFTCIFQHMKVFTELVNVMFEKDRVYIQAMDNSHVSVFELHLPKEWFDEYIHPTDETFTLGVNTNIFFKILNARDKTQTIRMEYEKGNEDKLFVHFSSENKTEFDKHFETILVDLENDQVGIPEMEYQAEFSLLSSNFANIISQLKMFGDSLEIECTDDHIMLYSNSAEQGKMFVEIKIDDLSSYAMDDDQDNLKIMFSLSYLHNICQFNKLAKEVDIKISKDIPMKLVYHLNGDENAKMMFFLAPKINED